LKKREEKLKSFGQHDRKPRQKTSSGSAMAEEKEDLPPPPAQASTSLFSPPAKSALKTGLLEADLSPIASAEDDRHHFMGGNHHDDSHKRPKELTRKISKSVSYYDEKIRLNAMRDSADEGDSDTPPVVAVAEDKGEYSSPHDLPRSDSGRVLGQPVLSLASMPEVARNTNFNSSTTGASRQPGSRKVQEIFLDLKSLLDAM
jgi:hypothetical protein